MEDVSLEQLDLSRYITAEKLAAMSDLEKKCCANQIRNYEMMKSIGIHIVYFFMIAFKHLAVSVCANTLCPDKK